jgi:GT2 family glycosyltransferase
VATVPALSLVVATMGRPDTLERLFQTLSQSDERDFEVVLVDQSPSTASPGVQALATRYAPLLALTSLRDEGRGLSRARNLGLAHARGALLGFPDDDCWYPAETVGRVIRFFAAHPDTGILAGQYTEPGIRNPRFSQTAGVLSAANLANRTSSVGTFLNRAGLHGQAIHFDERIGAGTALPAGEETDLLLRLLLAGVHGVYDPTLQVYHLIHRDKAVSSEAFLRLRMAYWYVVGKNHRPLAASAMVLKGALSCLVKPQRHGKALALRAMRDGYRAGRAARNATAP